MRDFDKRVIKLRDDVTNTFTHNYDNYSIFALTDEESNSILITDALDSIENGLKSIKGALRFLNKTRVWIRASECSPPIGQIVEIKYDPRGTRASVCDDWVSTGWIVKPGLWSMKKVDLMHHKQKPTHWRPLHDDEAGGKRELDTCGVLKS